KALTLNVSLHQREAAESLNSLADLMRRETNQLDPKIAWQNLGLGEFGPQMNFLTELIQEEQPQGQALEMPFDQDDEVDAPPGLEPILDEELPSMSETASEAVATELAAWAFACHKDWNQRSQPFTPEQWARIRRTELTSSLIAAGIGNISGDTQTDVQWQNTFQSHELGMPLTETNSGFELESDDPNEPIGLFGLHVSEPCLVTTR
ncbi:MAG: hypothetical protein GY835_19855, partial [bacterium]|nr:hypothetical protein [bacterium]